MLPCNHYLVKFHYHNCVPSDFKQALPSVPPYAPTEVDGPQALSCFPAQSKSTPPHCSNCSWSFAFWCKVYKGVIMTQLPSATRRWQCNQLSANELSCACMRLSGPHSAKSGCYPLPSNQTQAVEVSMSQKGSASLQLSCPHTEIQIEATKVAGKYLKTKCFCPISSAKRSWRCFVQVSWKPIIIVPAPLFTEECVPGRPGWVVFWTVKNVTIRLVNG